MKKKMIVSSILFALCFGLFAETYHVLIKGDVTIKTADNEFIAIEVDEDGKGEADVEDTDSLILGENSKVTFYIDGKPIDLQTRNTSKTYKVAAVVKR